MNSEVRMYSIEEVFRGHRFLAGGLVAVAVLDVSESESGVGFQRFRGHGRVKFVGVGQETQVERRPVT